MTFDDALAHVLRHEGGYSDHPKDPGGATMRGVTQETYDGWRSRRGEGARPVRQITDDEVREIYRVQYWDRVRGDDLPDGLNLAVFDWAVNSGTGRAATELQRLVHTRADGIIGENTLAAVRRVNDLDGLIDGYCTRRLKFLRGLRTWRTFGKGWTRRVEAIRSASLARVSALAPDYAPLPMARAMEVDDSPTVAIAKTWGVRAFYTGGGATAAKVAEKAGDVPFTTLSEPVQLALVLGGVALAGLVLWLAGKAAVRRGWI